MPKILHGVVHGRVIELQTDPGLAEGCSVEIEVRNVTMELESRPRVASAAGMVSDWSDEDDRLLDEIHAARKAASHRDSEQ
jgi:hypothetical protein